MLFSFSCSLLSVFVTQEHCLIGSAGHCVVDNIQDQLELWSIEQGKCVDYVYKGENNLTEMYSAIGAAVPVEGDLKTHRNTELLNVLRNAKKVISQYDDDDCCCCIVCIQ